MATDPTPRDETPALDDSDTSEGNDPVPTLSPDALRGGKGLPSDSYFDETEEPFDESERAPEPIAGANESSTRLEPADETNTGQDESFVSPVQGATKAAEVFDDGETSTHVDDTGSDRTEKAASDRHSTGDDTTARVGDATELEPETAEDFTASGTATEKGGGSLYPGKMPNVRAPGWEHSRQLSRDDGEQREVHRPGSAPSLEPASVPSLHSYREQLPDHGEDLPAMTPAETVDDAAVTPPPPTSPQARKFTAVDAAAKELARAALQAEIEKEEKQAMRGYEPEEGEIPPSPEVAKRFDVILQLGRGGMAVVYLCRDPRRHGKVLAVKDIRAELKPGMKVEQRVEHEAMLLKTLDHPGIVKVYDFLKFPRGSAIVMEYIDGLPLDHEIGAGRRVHWDFGVKVLHDIGQALHYAHGKGIIHRDIKPDNILYSERHGYMKLVDFGLARIFGETPEIQMTRTGMVVGTPHYMSPEQVSGKALDQRSDVYSFGATLYYLLTGQRHVEGTNVMDILEQQRSKDILPPSHVQRDIPAWVSYILGKMMEIKPEDRYQTMQEVLEDIERAEENPREFVETHSRGPVKRYGGVELSPHTSLSDMYAGEDGVPSGLSPVNGERPTDRVTGRRRRTTRSSQAEILVAQMQDADVSPAQISAMLKEISGRLERNERRMVGPGMLVLIVLLCVLIVVLAIAGALLYAAREGYLQHVLSL